jgi:ribosomal protein S11
MKNDYLATVTSMSGNAAAWFDSGSFAVRHTRRAAPAPRVADEWPPHSRARLQTWISLEVI